MSTEADRQEKLQNAKKKLKSYRARQANKAAATSSNSSSTHTRVPSSSAQYANSHTRTTSSTRRNSALFSASSASSSASFLGPLPSPSTFSQSHSNTHTRRQSNGAAHGHAHRRSASRTSVFGPPSAGMATLAGAPMSVGAGHATGKRDSRGQRLSWNLNMAQAQAQAVAREKEMLVERERENGWEDISPATGSAGAGAGSPEETVTPTLGNPNTFRSPSTNGATPIASGAPAFQFPRPVPQAQAQSTPTPTIQQTSSASRDARDRRRHSHSRTQSISISHRPGSISISNLNLNLPGLGVHGTCSPHLSPNPNASASASASVHGSASPSRSLSPIPSISAAAAGPPLSPSAGSGRSASISMGKSRSAGGGGFTFPPQRPSSMSMSGPMAHSGQLQPRAVSPVPGSAAALGTVNGSRSPVPSRPNSTNFQFPPPMHAVHHSQSSVSAAPSAAGTGAAGPSAAGAGGHARRASRHSRRYSVSTRRESMEIMAGLPVPSACFGFGGTSPELAVADTAVDAISPLLMSGDEGMGRRGSATETEDEEDESVERRAKRRSEALEALEGRLRESTAPISLDLEPDSNNNDSVQLLPATSRESKRASWGPSSVMQAGAKGALDLGMVEEEDEEEEEGSAGGNASGSRRSSKRKSAEKEKKEKSRPTSLFLPTDRFAKRQSWSKAGAGVGGVGGQPSWLKGSPRSPLSPAASSSVEKESVPAVTPPTTTSTPPATTSSGPAPSIGFATRSLNLTNLPTSTSASPSNIDTLALISPPKEHPSTSSIPSTSNATANHRGLRSLTLGGLSSLAHTASSQPSTPNSEAPTSAGFAMGTGTGLTSPTLSSRASSIFPGMGGRTTSAPASTKEEKAARRRSTVASALASANGSVSSLASFAGDANVGSGSQKKRSMSNVAKRSSISYKPAEGSMLVGPSTAPLAIGGGGAMRRMGSARGGGGRMSVNASRSSFSVSGRASVSSMASIGVSVEDETEGGEESEAGEFRFGDLVIGEEQEEEQERESKEETLVFGRPSPRPSPRGQPSEDPLLVSMLRTEIEQLRFDAVDRDNRAADEVKGLHDRSRELERELDDVRALAREHSLTLASAQSRALEAERVRDSLMEDVESWRGRSASLERQLERERGRAEEERERADEAREKTRKLAERVEKGMQSERAVEEMRERVFDLARGAEEERRVAGEWRERAERAESEVEMGRREMERLREEIERLKEDRVQRDRVRLPLSASDDDRDMSAGELSSTRLSSPASGQSSFSFSHSASSSGATSVNGLSGSGICLGANLSTTDVSVPLVLGGSSLQTLAEENEEDDIPVPASASGSLSVSGSNPSSASESEGNAQMTTANTTAEDEEEEKIDEAAEELAAAQAAAAERAHRRTGSFVRQWTFPHGTVPLLSSSLSSHSSPKSRRRKTGTDADDEAGEESETEEQDDHSFFQLAKKRRLPALPVNPATLELPPFFLGGLQIEEVDSALGMGMSAAISFTQQPAKRGLSISTFARRGSGSGSAPPPSRSARYASTSSSSISSASSHGDGNSLSLSNSGVSSPTGPGSRLSLQGMASLFTAYVAGGGAGGIASMAPQSATVAAVASSAASKMCSTGSTPIIGMGMSMDLDRSSPVPSVASRSSSQPPSATKTKPAAPRSASLSPAPKRLVDPAKVAVPKASERKVLDFTRMAGTRERVIYL